MEKKIKLRMESNKDIVVLVDGEKKLTIESNNRNINANAIYGLLDYSKNDTYSVESLNDLNVDMPVLNFFTDLIKDITNKLNVQD